MSMGKDLVFELSVTDAGNRETNHGSLRLTGDAREVDRLVTAVRAVEATTMAVLSDHTVRLTLTRSERVWELVFTGIDLETLIKVLKPYEGECQCDAT